MCLNEGKNLNFHECRAKCSEIADSRIAGKWCVFFHSVMTLYGFSISSRFYRKHFPLSLKILECYMLVIKLTLE
jgi:hypothetical protein